MTDLSATISPKSDQLNADDLLGGRTMTITVTKVTGTTGDQPISIHYEGDNGKPYKPCKSMRRVLVHCWGSDGTKYAGRKMTLFADPEVKFGGIAVGGIRISHMSHIKSAMTMALTATRGSKKPYKVLPLQEQASASPELLKSGNDAALQGTEAYKNWLAGLEQNDKESIRHMHSEWSKLAKESDGAF